jgi:hypothetical protein
LPLALALRHQVVTGGAQLGQQRSIKIPARVRVNNTITDIQ